MTTASCCISELSVPQAGLRKKFTLIELLVVISIISILAALLLPVLNKAKASAYAAACINKLKQTGVGLNSYLNDNREFFPLTTLAGDNLTWACKLAVYLRPGAKPNSYFCQSHKNTLNLFLCPAEIHRKTGCYFAQFPGTDDLRCTSYGINPYLEKHRLSEVKSPTRTMFSADHGWLDPGYVSSNCLGNRLSFWANCNLPQKESVIFPWHGRKPNVLFVMGNVDRVSYMFFYKKTNEENFPWNKGLKN